MIPDREVSHTSLTVLKSRIDAADQSRSVPSTPAGNISEKQLPAETPTDTSSDTSIVAETGSVLDFRGSVKYKVEKVR